MKRVNWILLGLVAALILALTVSTSLANQESKEQAIKAKVKLPAAVAKAVKDNFPNAEIEMAEVEEEAGITLYNIEFKAGKGEIEVAQDGTVMDVATIVAMKDIPKAAAEAIHKAAYGATIKQLEKSEVRAEIKKEGEKGKMVNLDSPKYIYEAEVVKGNQRGEMEVAADGKVAEIEEAIAASDLPAAVQQTLAKEYPGAKVLKAEKMTRGDQELFELRIQVKDKKMGVTIDPNGKTVEKTEGTKETEKK